MIMTPSAIRYLIGQVHRCRDMDHDDREDALYKPWSAYAHIIKIYAQMITGVVIFFLLLSKAILPLFGVSPCDAHPIVVNDLASVIASHLSSQPQCDFFGGILQKNTLAIVGDGLMYSAGFELAYMLFTPGPDEAIEPVILGMAATILIIISDDKIEVFDAIVPATLTLSMGFLFYLKKVFLPKHEPGASLPKQARMRMVVVTDAQSQPNQPNPQDKSG